MARFLALTFALTYLTNISAFAQPRQDTLRLTLASAEKTFLDSNFQLLAQRYNIDAQDALVIQARLYPNPNFSIGHTLYSAQLRQFFPTGINDETTMQLDQEILNHKQQKLARIAEANDFAVLIGLTVVN